MRFTLLLALLLSFGSPARAQDAAAPATPVLAQLLKQPEYFRAWQTLFVGEFGEEAIPDWITEYTKTLDGPPTPSIPVTIDNQTYLLGFTCKPNDCEAFQLFVLFAPDGSQAWALMGSPLTGVSWLGKPDKHIRSAVAEVLDK